MKRIVVFSILFAAMIISVAFARPDNAGAAGVGATRAYVGGPLKVLTANVGNADIFGCGNEYIFKLCMVKVELKVAEEIKKIDPDLIALQEVYYDGFCAEKPKDKNKKRICYEHEKKLPRFQAKRLLPEGYTIVCDGRANFECIGLKTAVGSIKGCPDGEICFGPEAAITLPAPEGCETYPVIFGVDVEIGGRQYRIINGHPAASSGTCRAADVANLFRGGDAVKRLADPSLKVLAMGDMNLDPFTTFEDDSIKTWREFVGEARPFYYLNGPAEHVPPYPTNAGRAIDHVITNFAKGECVTLGREPGFPRLDGTVGDVDPAGTDHSPVLCELTF